MPAKKQNMAHLSYVRELTPYPVLREEKLHQLVGEQRDLTWFQIAVREAYHPAQKYPSDTFRLLL